MSKFDQNRTRRLRKTLHKQTERKTNRHYENNGHLAVNQQVVKVIWHKATSPPQTDGSIVFARLRQCALTRGHIGATWQIRLSLRFLVPTRVHKPSSKSIGVAIFAQCRQARPGMSFPLINAHSRGVSRPNLIHASMGQPKCITKTPSWTVQLFLHRITAQCHYTLLQATSPLKITPSTWFLGPIPAYNQNGISIGFVIFAGLMTVTDRQTDQPTDSHDTWYCDAA